MIIHIFNSKSEWVAYIVNSNVFSAETNDWIGWLDNNDFYSPMGEYLGELTQVGSVYRILRNLTQLPKFGRIPPIPPIPPIPSTPPIPPVLPNLPSGYIDIFDEKEK